MFTYGWYLPLHLRFPFTYTFIVLQVLGTLNLHIPALFVVLVFIVLQALIFILAPEIGLSL